jgi:hypothetical protein
MSILPENRPDGGEPDGEKCWFDLSDEELNARLLESVRQAAEDLGRQRPDVPLTPAAEEHFLCDLVATLARIPKEDIDLLYTVEPDGSHIRNLEHLPFLLLADEPVEVSGAAA